MIRCEYWIYMLISIIINLQYKQIQNNYKNRAGLL
jgi:hypothetical protein